MPDSQLRPVLMRNMMLVAATAAHGVIFDQALSPAQQRNLERALGVPVIDRTFLILEIFSRRARTRPRPHRGRRHRRGRRRRRAAAASHPGGHG